MADRMGARDYIRSVNDFVFLRDEPQPADALFVPGSAEERHVLLAAKLWHEGYAPVIVPSGRYAIGAAGFAGDPAYPTEWAWMRSVLLREGAPDAAILREDQATYTWENALYSRRVTDAQGLTIRRGLLCCKAHHARRALLYYQAAYPDTDWIVCPAVVPGFGPDDWYLTEDGRTAILGEVRRLGDQITREFELLLREGGAPHDHA